MSKFKLLVTENKIDSRQVAEMVGKQHKDLLRDIRGYVDIMINGGERKFAPSDFFLESSYISDQSKILPCYLITRKGCEMVANKMTGEKGVLFTAAYIEAFHEMEQQLKQPMPQMTQLEIIAAIAQGAVEQEKQLKQIAATQVEHALQLQGIRNVVALNPHDWRKDTSALINKMALKLGGYENVQPMRAESYKLLNERFGVDLQCRLTNKRRRMADEGICKSRRDKLNQLDVISDDKKLIEGYVIIIKEMAIKYGVDA